MLPKLAESLIRQGWKTIFRVDSPEMRGLCFLYTTQELPGYMNTAAVAEGSPSRPVDSFVDVYFIYIRTESLRPNSIS